MATKTRKTRKRKQASRPLQPLVRRLRRALRDIRGQLDPHIGDRGEDLRQDPECFCPRCIAVRALSPNEASSATPDTKTL
jgi:hypothetical protein